MSRKKDSNIFGCNFSNCLTVLTFSNFNNFYAAGYCFHLVRLFLSLHGLARGQAGQSIPVQKLIVHIK